MIKEGFGIVLLMACSAGLAQSFRPEAADNWGLPQDQPISSHFDFGSNGHGHSSFYRHALTREDPFGPSEPTPRRTFHHIVTANPATAQNYAYGSPAGTQSSHAISQNSELQRTLLDVLNPHSAATKVERKQLEHAILSFAQKTDLARIYSDRIVSDLISSPEPWTTEAAQRQLAQTITLAANASPWNAPDLDKSLREVADYLRKCGEPSALAENMVSDIRLLALSQLSD